MDASARRAAGERVVATGGASLFRPGTRAHDVIRVTIDRALGWLRPHRTRPVLRPIVVTRAVVELPRIDTSPAPNTPVGATSTRSIPAPATERGEVVDLTSRGGGRPPQPQGPATREPSKTLQQLLDAATAAGIEGRVAPRLVRTILATLADRLPPHVRNRVSAQLPSDVCEMFAPLHDARRAGSPRSVPEFVSLIAVTAPDLSREKVQHVTIRVLRALCSLLPECLDDGIAEVLPSELRFLWKRAVAV